MSLPRARARLFARCRGEKRAADAHLDPQAVRAVEQCLGGFHDGAPECVSAAFGQALRDVAFAMGVDYESIVAPHYYALGEYDRCIYTWRGAGGGWLTLAFDCTNRALLTVVDAPSAQNLVGAFSYDTCAERHAIRLHDVGPYAEVLLQPLVCSENVRFIIPETGTDLVLTNHTPQRLARSSSVAVS